MKTQRHTICATLTTAGLFVGSLTLLPAGEVGPMAAFAPPAPVSDCDACNAPGWYAGASLLYLESYGDSAQGGTMDGDWDLGARGTLGFERPDGLFIELNGFWYEGDYDYENYSGEIDSYYIEALIGDNLHCGEACLDYAFGLRYASLEKSGSFSESINSTSLLELPEGNGQGSNFREYEGFGPVVRLDGVRPLNDRVSLYAGLSQALLFGEEKESEDSDDDKVAFVTELEGGIQIGLNAGQLQDAHVRLGIEAQYWSFDEHDTGFFGGVLGAGFNF